VVRFSVGAIPLAFIGNPRRAMFNEEDRCVLPRIFDNEV
jgi:hypothetical protein